MRKSTNKVKKVRITKAEKGMRKKQKIEKQKNKKIME